MPRGSESPGDEWCLVLGSRCVPQRNRGMATAAQSVAGRLPAAFPSASMGWPKGWAHLQIKRNYGALSFFL